MSTKQPSYTNIDTLWWTNIAMERSTIFHGKIHYKWPFYRYHRCTSRKNMWLQDRRAVFSVRGSVLMASVHWPQRSWKTQPAQPNQLVYPVSYFFRSLEIPRRCSCGVDTWGLSIENIRGNIPSYPDLAQKIWHRTPNSSHLYWFIIIFSDFPYENWHLIIWGVTPHHSLAALVEDGVMLRHHQVTIPGASARSNPVLAHQSQLATWDLLNKVGMNDRYMLS